MRPDRARPTLCLITDRRRLTAALGRPENAWQETLRAQIAGAIAGGIDIVQIRERAVDAGLLTSFAKDCVALAEGSGARVVVNDRLDVALAAGAGGVHLREDSIAIARARTLASPGFLLGRSVHGPEASRQSDGADYLIAGHVFETPSKPGAGPGIGIAGLEAIVRAASPPVWAIGGITAVHIPALLAAGAAGVAGISAFIPSTGGSDVATAVQELTESWRFAFDSRSGLP
jgi:thiamine-phosphate pyrophosphorylase